MRVAGQVRSDSMTRQGLSDGTFRGDSDPFYLPNFCASRAAVAIVVIAELTAIVLSIARSGAVSFWSELARSSLFLLWIGLVCAALLCVLRPSLARLGVGRGSTAALVLLTAVVAAVSIGVFLLGASGAFTAAAPMLFPRRLGPFVLRNTAIGFVIAAVTLRYFYVTHQWRRNIEMRAAARVHALQARIRPHFLFNSMNTIAALTRTAPRQAEQAVQDLAELFRASLADPHQSITLADELEIARTYQRIEQLRLGERLRVSWEVESLPADARVPGLLLQPLLENAIYHGIEPRTAGGTVQIRGEQVGGLISVVMRNPLGPPHGAREGHHLALENIRERLVLLYGERALVKAGRFGDEYIVTLRFPYIAAAKAAAGAA